MFRYSIHQGWEEIPDTEIETVFRHFNDNPCGLRFGCRDNFNVFVFKQKRRKIKSAETALKDQFLALVGIGEQGKGEELQKVLVPALPDLLNFMNQVLPLCVEARKMGEADEKLEDEVNQVLQKYK